MQIVRMTWGWTILVCWLAAVAFMPSSVLSETNAVQMTVVEGDNVQLKCGEDPKDVPPTKSTRRPCNWTDVSAPVHSVLIFSGNYPCSNDTKYDNFVPLEYLNGSRVALNITNALYEDEGWYECQAPSQDEQTTHLTVEAEVNRVTMETGHGRNETIRVREGVGIKIFCTAFAARPVVQIQWFIGATEIHRANETTRVNAGNADTTDTISSLKFTPTRSDQGNKLMCTTAGQEKAKPKSKSVLLEVKKRKEKGKHKYNRRRGWLLLLVALGGVALGFFAAVYRRRQLRHQQTTESDHQVRHNRGYQSDENPEQGTSKPGHRDHTDIEVNVVAPAAMCDLAGPSTAPQGAANVDVDSTAAFPQDLVVVERELGQGAYGRVLLGSAFGLEEPGKRTKVAIKTFRDGAGAKTKEEFLHELKIMQKIGSHPNVVKLLGYCTETPSDLQE